jgi:hypothetical protein
MMDPSSAAVAFVGLGASIVTLAGLALESYSILKRVFSAFKHAPREVARLCHQLAEIESVLKLIGCHAVELEPGARIVLASVICGMHQDLSELRGDVKKLEKLLEKERAASRQLEARLRHVLLESKIKEHRRRATSYIAQLNLLLTMSNR